MLDILQQVEARAGMPLVGDSNGLSWLPSAANPISASGARRDLATLFPRLTPNPARLNGGEKHG